MRAAALLTTIFLLLIAVSCEPKITEGTVIEKTYRPSWVYMQPYPAGKGVVLVPIVMPEEWFVVIEEDGVKASFNVTHEDYNNIVIGQRLKIDTEKKKKR